jgi:hypothetical protein
MSRWFHLLFTVHSWQFVLTSTIFIRRVMLFTLPDI